MSDEETTVEEAPAAKAPAKKKATPKKKAPAVVEETTAVEEVVEEAEVVEDTITVAPETKRVRVKGTWRMYFNGQPWDFTDGEYYELPLDLYGYLRGSGNIYDTMA